MGIEYMIQSSIPENYNPSSLQQSLPSPVARAYSGCVDIWLRSGLTGSRPVTAVRSHQLRTTASDPKQSIDMLSFSLTCYVPAHGISKPIKRERASCEGLF